MAPRKKTAPTDTAAQERADHLHERKIAEVPVTGGAKIEEIETVPAMPDAESGIAVIATRRGAGPNGLVEPGTRFTVAPRAYSPRWMRPADEAAAKALDAWRTA